MTQTFGGNAYISQLKEVFFALTEPNSLPSDAALSLYVCTSLDQNGTIVDWSFKGFISNARPSDVMPLSIDHTEGGEAKHVYIGITWESLTEVSSKFTNKMALKEDFCKRVGMDLFQYMQSFSGASQQVSPEYILVPANVLDTWFNRISSRLKNDPDFLTRKKEII
jgi:hypothetical protein